jgi:hypothetical protein
LFIIVCVVNKGAAVYIALLIIPGGRDPELCVVPQDFLQEGKTFFFALLGARVRGRVINMDC